MPQLTMLPKIDRNQKYVEVSMGLYWRVCRIFFNFSKKKYPNCFFKGQLMNPDDQVFDDMEERVSAMRRPGESDMDYFERRYQERVGFHLISTCLP